MTITGIEKQGPVIICMTDDSKGRTYRLDFKEGKIYGIAGRPLLSAASILDKTPYELKRTNFLFTAFEFFSCNSEYPKEWYNVVESLLSYPDLLSGRIESAMVYSLVHEYDCKLPKGYIAWCREVNAKISMSTLNEFVEYQEFMTWPQALKDTVKKISDGCGFNIAKATKYDKELTTSLIKIINNSIKLYQFDCIRRTSDIIDAIAMHPNLRPYLDETKNAKVAYEILKDLLNKERNDKILANEAKIAALNGMIIDDLIIKVPSCMQDFTDEGEQQHNCVGHYYHNSIADGRNLIYFLRKATEPDKSYVTCRYSRIAKKTVEHRVFCNGFWDNKELLNKIDQLIIELLK